MRFAARMNSFSKKYTNAKDIIRAMGKIDGLTDIEINIPEHLSGSDYAEMSRIIQDAGMNFSGAAVRYRDDFITGEFGNPGNRDAAVDLAKRAVDTVAAMGGETVTIWLAYDGFDYSFQIDYAAHWNAVVSSFQKIADHNRDIRISIEFKPWSPRIFSIMPDTGTTLHALSCIDRENVGMTLDFCHSLMAGENPSMSLVLAGLRNRLFGIHLNDGNGFADDGHIFGSDNLVKSMEFMYYLKRQAYDGLIYFDTFPTYEDPDIEVALNLRLFKAYEEKVEQIGFEKISSGLQSQEEMSGQRFVLDNIL